jgi:hypothetical protein
MPRAQVASQSITSQMKQPAHPFRLPRSLDADLAYIRAYWRGLLRGAAEMPFADDLDLKALADVKQRLMVIEVFAEPERYRFDIVGEAITAPEIVGRFADEIEPRTPLEFVRAQLSVTLEVARPTYYKRDPGAAAATRGYSRLLLPMWGDGHISLVLGAIAWR